MSALRLIAALSAGRAKQRTAKWSTSPESVPLHLLGRKLAQAQFATLHGDELEKGFASSDQPAHGGIEQRCQVGVALDVGMRIEVGEAVFERGEIDSSG